MPEKYRPISDELEQFMERPPQEEDKPTLTPDEIRRNREWVLQSLEDNPEGGD